MRTRYTPIPLCIQKHDALAYALRLAACSLCCLLFFLSPYAVSASELSLDSPQDILGMSSSKDSQTQPRPSVTENEDTDLTSNATTAQTPPSAVGDVAGNASSDTSGSESAKTSESSSPAATAKGKKTMRLFGSVEFRGPLKNIPKWENVLRKERQQPSFAPGSSIPPDVRKRWEALKAKLNNASIMEKMKGVNSFFNQWPYKTDIVNWKVEDYWETPAEFMTRSGDCEDYAITKYYALKELGVPVEQLRIVAVIERIRNIGHAVLVVFVDDKAYVLDNLSNLILQHDRLTSYDPKFSVNEQYRWVHVRPLPAHGK